MPIKKITAISCCRCEKLLATIELHSEVSDDARFFCNNACTKSYADKFLPIVYSSDMRKDKYETPI